MYSQLSICLFVSSANTAQFLKESLSDGRYHLHFVDSAEAFIHHVKNHTEEIDCLIVLSETAILPIFNQLYEQGTLLPVVIIDALDKEVFFRDNLSECPIYFYHNSEVHLKLEQLGQINTSIDLAITQFLHLAPSCLLSSAPKTSSTLQKIDDHPSSLILQQRRLAEKLKERLGYLGVYYKRDPKYFYRNLFPDQKKNLLQQLNSYYRDIILCYFSQDSDVNQLIDQLVNQAFFADVSASQFLEIHMKLMDEFAQQLKLEGRNEEILLDYRLTLIDVLAHLGEMYRRSIPREDIPLDLLYRIE